MNFVDLHRSFVPITKNQEANLDVGRIWGRKMGGWPDWSELLEKRRVVLLAEALSGKTEEFQHQAEKLTHDKKAAFFIRIEDLADDGFEAALERSAVQAFECWRDGTSDEEGWFFLDSVDEARLNHKSLEKALRRFGRELHRGLDRSRVFVSCRVSDWKGGEDSAAIERLLPIWEKPAPPALEDDEAALLDPIFRSRREASRSPPESDSAGKIGALLVVQLVPLTSEQRGALASAAGVKEPERFVEAIEKSGLDALAERPGDLLYLAEYWETRGRFGSLAEMFEHGVAQKLLEQDQFRPDNRDLPPAKAREGAERLAAALTFGKSFTLRAPGHDPDPTLVVGALDPVAVLEEWTDAARNALTRRGVFAPSTYGRIRFHHQGTQEYLAAKWLDRLLQADCPRVAVWNLIFSERYDIETLVPSLHGAAAWLALGHPDIRDEIIRREPLVLLRYGDPHSLPLEAKEQLLFSYATRHAAGQISNDSLDHRALWMFADPALADAIRTGWAINNREEFHRDLLRMVREGAISACADLARSAALSEAADEYLRIVALEALDACGDSEGLTEAAIWLTGAAGRVSANLAAHWARVLFPRHLAIDGLLHLMAVLPEVREGALGAFGGMLGEFWKSCLDAEAQRQLLAGLADLCLSPPFADEYLRISARHKDLAEDLVPLVRDVVLELGDIDVPESLVRALMAVERAGQQGPDDADEPSLGALVPDNPNLNRRLFWADVEEKRQNASRLEGGPTHICQVFFHGGRLWRLGPKELEWLFDDLSNRTDQADKRIALSAIVEVLKETDRLDEEIPRLRSLVAGAGAVEQDLDRYLAPPTAEEEEYRLRRLARQHQRNRDAKDQAAKQSWIQFREELTADPTVLCDPDRLAGWTTGAHRLYSLSNWLCRKTSKGHQEAALQWRLLEEGFGRPVAEAYRDGMKTLWRVTTPERPKRKKGKGVSTKWTTILAIAGLGIESAEDQGWTSSLTKVEAELAAQHACLTEQGYQEWIEPLASQHPDVVLPILRKVLQEEWSGRRQDCAEFFPRYGRIDSPIQPTVQEILFEVITGKAPRGSTTLERGLRVLQRIDLSEGQRCKAVSLALRRLRTAGTEGDEDERFRNYLAMLFLLDVDRATTEFDGWLHGRPSAPCDARAEGTFGALFGHDSPLGVGALQGASVTALETLVHLAYLHVRPEEDRIHEGVFTPNGRDRAEEARNALLNVLIARPGADAYRAVRKLAASEVCRGRTIRLHEIAHGKAEQDAELPAWTPAEVLAFERDHIAPAKTGEALLRVVMGVLSDIQLSFDHGDATSRPLLQRAKDEPEVQAWLAEQLNLLSKGRYHAYREAQVSGGDKPDIIVSSTAARVEVAVEVKHGGKKWSVRDLEHALRSQLAQRYLNPATRRHGVLVVSYHRQRTWRDPDTHATLHFSDVIERLQSLATTVVSNDSGPIGIRVFGVDASA